MSHQKLIEYINRKDWWHSPPQDPLAYKKRGKFLAWSFRADEFYGRPLDVPQRVNIHNPVVGDESYVHRVLFRKIIKLPFGEDGNFIKARLALDARMKRVATKKGFDSIVIMSTLGFKTYKKSGKIPRALELNIFEP